MVLVVVEREMAGVWTAIEMDTAANSINKRRLLKY